MCSCWVDPPEEYCRYHTFSFYIHIFVMGGTIIMSCMKCMTYKMSCMKCMAYKSGNWLLHGHLTCYLEQKCQETGTPLYKWRLKNTQVTWSMLSSHPHLHTNFQINDSFSACPASWKVGHHEKSKFTVIMTNIH